MHSNSKGFTIVELLISSAVFSFILIAVSITVVEIGRLYYKGTVLSRTQDSARNLIDSVSRPIQLEGSTVVDGGYPPPPSGNFQVYCIGATRYTVTYNTMQKSNPGPDDVRHAVWQDTVDTPEDCKEPSKNPNPNAANPSPSGEGRDMLGENMRVTDFSIVPVPMSNMYKIQIVVMYGDRDLMNPADQSQSPTGCATEIAGSQWCARAEYTTTVMKRITGGV